MIDLVDIPELLANALGIDVFAGEVIMTVVFMVIVSFPLAYMLRDTDNAWIVLTLADFMILVMAVAIGWLSIWFILVFGLLIALPIAALISGAVGGS